MLFNRKHSSKVSSGSLPPRFSELFHRFFFSSPMLYSTVRDDSYRGCRECVVSKSPKEQLGVIGGWGTHREKIGISDMS